MNGDTPPRITTAEGLGRFRKELRDQGITDSLADDLVRQAATALLEDGLVVKSDG